MTTMNVPLTVTPMISARQVKLAMACHSQTTVYLSIAGAQALIESLQAALNAVCQPSVPLIGKVFSPVVGSH